jgi:hypothetical protein
MMIDWVGVVTEAVTGGSVATAILLVAKVTNLKQILLLWAEHVEMRATVRKMRSEGASDKEVIRFLADQAKTRAGRSP